MRGTSKREDDVFWIIRLDEASKDERDGAQFLSRFTKDRNSQKEQAPIEWQFTTLDSRLYRGNGKRRETKLETDGNEKRLPSEKVETSKKRSKETKGQFFDNLVSIKQESPERMNADSFATAICQSPQETKRLFLVFEYDFPH